MCWTKFKTIGYSWKNFWPLSENSSRPLVFQAGYVPERSMCEKEALLPKSACLEPILALNRDEYGGGSIAYPKISESNFIHHGFVQFGK